MKSIYLRANYMLTLGLAVNYAIINLKQCENLRSHMIETKKLIQYTTL